MAPWVVRPRLPDPPPKGRATPDAVCKDYRRPAERAKVSGPVLLVEREVAVELDDGAEVVEVDETIEVVTERALVAEEGERVAQRLGRGEQA